MPYAEVKPVIDLLVRGLCRRRYPNHPRGCPNWNKRPTCPPQARLLGELLDLTKPAYAVWSVFDLGAHRERMKARHSGWTRRQTDCCLYWQGTARKVLRNEVKRFLEKAGNAPELLVLYCPEACGVNVTATMVSLGQQLEWPPIEKTYQVALIGTHDEFPQQTKGEKG